MFLVPEKEFSKDRRIEPRETGERQGMKDTHTTRLPVFSATIFIWGWLSYKVGGKWVGSVENGSELVKSVSAS